MSVVVGKVNWVVRYSEGELGHTLRTYAKKFERKFGYPPQYVLHKNGIRNCSMPVAVDKRTQRYHIEFGPVIFRRPKVLRAKRIPYE